MKYLGTRDENLPQSFSAAERAAYRWLYDCGVRPWTVDLLTHNVQTPGATYESLAAYRQHLEAAARAAGGGE